MRGDLVFTVSDDTEDKGSPPRSEGDERERPHPPQTRGRSEWQGVSDVDIEMADMGNRDASEEDEDEDEVGGIGQQRHHHRLRRQPQQQQGTRSNADDDDEGDSAGLLAQGATSTMDSVGEEGEGGGDLESQRRVRDEERLHGALAGSLFELRLAGICYACCSLRHLFMVGIMWSLVGGPILSLPWTIRCLVAQAVGLAVHRKFNVWDEAKLFRMFRALIIVMAVVADIGASIGMTVTGKMAADGLFREPSPSRPVNSYWQTVYWSCTFLGAVDVLSSIVPLLFLWRALYLSTGLSSQHRTSLYGVNLPHILSAVIFPKRSYLPNDLAVKAASYVRPVCLIAAVACSLILSFASASVLGLLNGTPSGKECHATYASSGNVECVDLVGVCDPIDPSDCLLPFPSDYLLGQDPKTETGFKVRISRHAMPPLSGGGSSYLHPDVFNDRDGFSTMQPILFRVGNGLGSVVQLPPGLAGAGPEAYLAVSTDADASPSLLIDLGTGQAVPHFLEPDIVFAEPPHASGTLMILQPGIALRNSARYAVAVRRLVAASARGGAGGSGSAAEASDGFKRMRDSRPRSGEEAERLKRWESSVFPAISAKGWDRGELQLAWEFSTVSWRVGPGRTQYMIGDAIERLQGGGRSGGRSGSWATPSYTIDDVVKESCSASQSGGAKRKGRQVWGSIMTPSYTTSPGPGSNLLRVVRGGVPIANGQVQVRFVALIPCSALESKDAPPPYAIQYGHGLMGTRSEAVESSWLRSYAEMSRAVVFAIDWSGMSRFDSVIVGSLLMARLSSFSIVPDQIQQGFVNGASAIWYLRNRLGSDASFLRVDGSKVVDPNAQVAFYGISQGAILGGGYVLSSPYISRSVLSVPGTPFGLILPRSFNFYEGYLDLLRFQVKSNSQIRIVLSLLQQLWDTAETAGWLSGLGNLSSGVDSSKRFLLQAALGDAQVPTIAAQVMARSMNCSTLHHETRHVYGLEEAVSPVEEGSVYVEFAYRGVGPEPMDNTPASSSTNTHEVVRRDRSGQEQAHQFFATGAVQQTCSADRGCSSRDRVLDTQPIVTGT